MENKWKLTNFIFLGSKITVEGDCSHEIKKWLSPWKKSCDQPRQHIKKQRQHFTDKGPYSQSHGFSSSHFWMWELDHKIGGAQKNWRFQNVLKTLESKVIKPVSLKGNQPWIFIGRTDAEVEALILQPPDEKSQLIGKDPDAGEDWGQGEKGATEDEIIEWHHWLSGHEFEQTSKDSEGQESSVCSSSWDCKGLDIFEQLNNNSKELGNIKKNLRWRIQYLKWEIHQKE